MNAARLRKENQMYSTEKRQASALVNYNGKVQREEKPSLEFQLMLGENEQERNNFFLH